MKIKIKSEDEKNNTAVNIFLCLRYSVCWGHICCQQWNGDKTALRNKENSMISKYV